MGKAQCRRRGLAAFGDTPPSALSARIAATAELVQSNHSGDAAHVLKIMAADMAGKVLLRSIESALNGKLVVFRDDGSACEMTPLGRSVYTALTIAN